MPGGCLVNGMGAPYPGRKPMDQHEYVIFAELDSNRFEQIVARLGGHFERLQYGRQGDDWIWIDAHHGRIEIDTFGALVLEVKGQRGHYGIAMEVCRQLDSDWILRTFMPPKPDPGR